MSNKAERIQPLPFIEVLNGVMKDPNYLVGSEPEDSGWDFHDWTGQNFREFGGWVLAQKFFAIAAIDNRMLSIRIVQIDPEQFDVNGAKISFVISPVTAKGFPTILIGKDPSGKEVILRNSADEARQHEIPEYFQGLAQEVSGVIETRQVKEDTQGSEWAKFLKDVLQAKKFFPADFKATDFIIRDWLELEPDDTYSERDALLAEMQLTEQEMLGIGFADFSITLF